MKGVIYSITLSVLLLFITLFVSSLISSYENINSVFYDFITNKKSIDDYNAIKYSLNSIVGVSGEKSVNVSFPFYLSSQTVGRDLEAFTKFLNETYSKARFSNISVDASALISVINSGALGYEIVPYSVVIEKQPGNAEKILVSNLSSLKGIVINVESDAFVANNYWKNPGYSPGNFNFTFNEIGVPISYFISNSSNADYVLNFEKNGSSVGSVDISFSFSQNVIKIEERNIKFDKVNELKFVLDFLFEQSSTITTSPSVNVFISDYLNKTVIKSFI